MTRKPLIKLALLVVVAAAGSASNCKPARITVTAPPASVLEGGSKTSVSWTTQNMVSDVKIDLTVDDGATFTNLVPAAPFNAGTQEVTLPNPGEDVSSKAFIRITNLDNSAQFGDSQKFSIVAMTERYITFAEVNAIRPGAFTVTRTGPPSDCQTLDQVDGTLDAVKYAALPRGVLYRIKCTRLNGGQANVTSFGSFILSNGWVVSKVDTFQGEKSGGAEGVNSINCTLPAVGANSPAITCRLAANVGAVNEFVVAPWIRGRKGTAPF
jgi:hypothetical protein